MFEKARLKLTGWYLLIIMLISLSFSGFIYESVTREFQRRLHGIETRYDFQTTRGRMLKTHQPLFIEDIEIARKSVLLLLIYANGTILVFSGLAGYFLAGKTLKPIENALDDQKRFVADASHEIKTPLTSLQTSIEVALRDKGMSLKDAKKVLKENLADVSSMNKLANDLLRLTWYQAGDDNLNIEKVNIVKIIDEVKKKVEPLAKKKKIKMIYKVKNIKIMADREGLEKLLTILCDNAIKFTPKRGQISLIAKKTNKHVLIKVKDTGYGIEKRDIPLIFDRFYRADQSRSKTKADGFGLGLSMAKRIVELHKGSIKAKSKKSKGSTFTVKLPVSLR